MHIKTTHEEYFVDFIVLQNLVGIHAVVSIIWRALSTTPQKGTSFQRNMSYDVEIVKTSSPTFAQLTLLPNT